MGICPSLDPQIRVLYNHNQSLKQILLSELKDLRIYNFYSPVLNSVQNLPTRYMYNEGILQDIDKLRFYAQRKGISSIQSRVSGFGQNPFQQQIKNSCLILQNQLASQVESKQFQKQRQQSPQQQQQGDENMNPNFQGTHSFQNNLTRNQSLVAQMNIIYGREINREQYSEALKLFLKWVQYFNEHSFGGFLKTIYKSFCQSLYRLQRTQFETLVDEVCMFVQYMVKVYTKIYNLQILNRSVDGKLFKNENVYNLVMSFMFRKTKIKSFIKSMVRQNNLNKIKTFQDKLKLYHNKSIAYFGIDNQFVLIKNQQWEQKLKKHHPSNNISIKNNHHNENNNHHTKNNINNDEANNINNDSKQYQKQHQQQNQHHKLLQSFKSRIQSTCYQKSLRLVNQLSSQNQAISPISKLKTIIAIARTIQQQINHFYIHQLHLSKKQVPQLDPDNLTAIIIYLIVTNNNSALFQQLKLIEYFTTTNTLNCISGYYLNVFVAAIQTVVELKI